MSVCEKMEMGKRMREKRCLRLVIYEIQFVKYTRKYHLFAVWKNFGCFARMLGEVPLLSNSN